MVIIFDLDGTLIDSMKLWEEVDIRFLAKRNIPLPEDLFTDLVTNSFKDMAIYFKQKFSLTESLEEIMNEWNQAVRHAYQHDLKLKEGCLDFLNFLKERHHTLAIGTSNSEYLTHAVLKQNNIFDYFATIVCGCSEIKGKPEPDIYLKVAENLGVKPTECLVFEDSLHGVLAAKNAGMKVFAIADESALPDKEQILSIADQYFENYFELIAVITISNFV